MSYPRQSRGAEVAPDSKPDYFGIPEVCLKLEGGRLVETSSAAVLLAVLREVAHTRDSIRWFRCGENTMTRDSVGALNSYLRTAQIGRMGLPLGTGATKHDWRTLADHLGLSFISS